jgi:hypothetical protein
MDITIQGASTATQIKFDSSGTWTTSNVSTVWSDGTINYTWAHSTNALVLSGTSHDNCALVLGTTNATTGMDLTIQGASTASQIAFDAGASTWTTTNVSQVWTDGTVPYTWAHSSNALVLSATSHANCALVLGTTNATTGMDLTIQGASTASQIAFDATAATWTTTNVSTVWTDETVAYTWSHSSNSLVLSGTSHANCKFIIGTSNATTGMDVVLDSASGTGNITWDAGARTLTSNSTCNIVATLTAGDEGLKIPYKAGTASTTTASVGSIVFDSANARIYVSDSGVWKYCQLS